METPDGDVFEVDTTDGRYRCQVLIVAVGVAEPFTPPGLGMEFTHHYAEVRPVEAYADHRILLIGKQNSGFELATGLLPWARQIVLTSPSRARLSVETKTLVGVRARYVQPYEDHVLGGGVNVLDAAVDRIERADDGRLTAYLRRTDGGPDLTIEVDDAISATGFVCPLQDLPALGVGTFGASRLPVQTPWWESAQVPGIYFAGTIGQGSKGLQKHGVPANSGAVHGARYNARVLAGHVAETHFGIRPEATHLAPDDVTGFIATELAEAPELFHQRGYLARVLTADPAGGMRDEGVQPLALRARRRRSGCDRGHPRGGRIRGDLPGRLHPDRRQGRGAGDRARSADARRHGRFASPDRRARRAGDDPLRAGPLTVARVVRR